jgi:hypothetical protein
MSGGHLVHRVTFSFFSAKCSFNIVSPLMLLEFHLVFLLIFSDYYYFIFFEISKFQLKNRRFLTSTDPIFEKIAGFLNPGLDRRKASAEYFQCTTVPVAACCC